MTDSLFPSSLKQSLLLHGIVLLLMIIIPLSAPIQKPEYIEVTLLKGGGSTPVPVRESARPAEAV